MAVNSVLITGSNRGIGLELVKQFSARKPSPKCTFAACRNPSKAEELQKLAEANPSIKVITLDVENEETYNTAYEEVIKQVEDCGLDVLINNAAITENLNLETVTSESLMRIFRVNSVGPLMIAKKFMPLLKKSSSQNTKRAIINISSSIGSLNMPMIPGFQYPYKISKAALNSVSVQLAQDLESEGIIVISQCPSWVKTDMGGADGMLTTEQSVSGIMAVFNKLNIDSSGKFYNQSGDIVPW